MPIAQEVNTGFTDGLNKLMAKRTGPILRHFKIPSQEVSRQTTQNKLTC
jgi:hypothetical protein